MYRLPLPVILVATMLMAAGCSRKLPSADSTFADAKAGVDSSTLAVPRETLKASSTVPAARVVRSPVPDRTLAREQREWDMQQTAQYGGPPLPPGARRVMTPQQANATLGPLPEELER